MSERDSKRPRKPSSVAPAPKLVSSIPLNDNFVLKFREELLKSSAAAGRLLAAERLDSPGAPLLEAPSPRVIVGFSGGPDSTALLLALLATASETGIEAIAAHINHG